MADLTSPWSLFDDVGAPAVGGQFLTWRDTWTLGISAMDEDHHAMAMLLDRIGSSFAVGAVGVPTARRLQRSLARLRELTRVHFAREETLMRETDYPDLLNHKAEHDMLLAELTIFTREAEAGGLARLEPGLLEALKGWFLGHLLDDDRRLADYLRSVGLEARH